MYDHLEPSEKSLQWRERYSSRSLSGLTRKMLTSSSLMNAHSVIDISAIDHGYMLTPMNDCRRSLPTSLLLSSVHSIPKEDCCQ